MTQRLSFFIALLFVAQVSARAETSFSYGQSASARSGRAAFVPPAGPAAEPLTPSAQSGINRLLAPVMRDESEIVFPRPAAVPEGEIRIRGNSFLSDDLRRDLGLPPAPSAVTMPKMEPPRVRSAISPIVRKEVRLLPLPTEERKPASVAPPKKVATLEDALLPVVGFLTHGNDACSGTLVAPQIVLTAGHCVDGVAAHDLYFTLDADPLHHPRALRARAAEVRLHPLYRAPEAGRPRADLAIVVLESKNYGPEPRGYYPFSFFPKLEPGTLAFGGGFGRNPDGSTGKLRYKPMLFEGTLDAEPTGAGDATTVRDAFLVMGRGPTHGLVCRGDSGGPLLAKHGKEIELVGVLSYTARSGAARTKPSLPADECSADKAAIFSSLAPYEDWLRTAMALKKTSDLGSYLSRAGVDDSSWHGTR